MKNKSFLIVSAIGGLALTFIAAGSVSAATMQRQRPAVRGSVTTISGNILTVTNASSTVYTIDATNATVTKGYGTTAQTGIANIVVGDTVNVMGTVSGNAVAATSIRDGVMPTKTSNTVVRTVNKTVTKSTVKNVVSSKTQKYANGTLLRGSDKKVYVITNGKKQPINTLKELAKYKGKKITDVSTSVLGQY
jgi:hypothetical protein